AGTISLRALKDGRLDSLVEHKTVLAVGPGISRHAETAELVRTLVSKYKVPMVVDADGLNAFEGHAEKLNGQGKALVITPHAGDIAREIMGERCLVATDLVKTLPQAFRRVQRDAQEKFVRING